jgi:hypothetical protein
VVSIVIALLPDQVFYIHQILDKNGSTMGQCISYSDFKQAYDSVKREVLYDILLNLIYLRS